GGTDGDRGVTDRDVVGVAQRQRVELGAARVLELDHGDVVALGAADDHGVVLLAVGEGRCELAAVGGGGDDVVVGEDVALGVVDETGARAALLAAARLDRHDAGERLVGYSGYRSGRAVEVLGVRGRRDGGRTVVVALGRPAAAAAADAARGK